MKKLSKFVAKHPMEIITVAGAGLVATTFPPLVALGGVVSLTGITGAITQRELRRLKKKVK